MNKLLLFGLLCAMAVSASCADGGPVVAIRFDDNHAPEEWRGVAGLFDELGEKCSFAVVSGTLTPEQGRCLKELSDRGFEIMDHTSSHGMYCVQYARMEDFSKVDTNLPFVVETHLPSRTIRCMADVDLNHELNLFLWASVSNSVLLCDDEGILPKLSWTKKVWIRSRKALFGVVMEGGRRELRDFHGRKVENFNEPPCEMILVHQAAIQPCQELLRMQASATRTNFDHFGIPRPKTWIQPGGWEAFVDARRLRDVYGVEFGYTGADCVMPFSTCWSSTDQPVPDEWWRWMQRPTFTFFDNGDVSEELWACVETAKRIRRPLPIISHISVAKVGGMENWLKLTRGFLRRLKSEGVPIITWAEMTDRFYGPLKVNPVQEGRLTPPASPAPRINTPGVLGAGVGREIVWRVPVSGEAPVCISVDGLEDLPGKRLTFNPQTRVLRGTVDAAGRYPLVICASNRHGRTEKEMALQVGGGIALTPPMGWNSWNCHFGMVNDGDLRRAADKLVETGLADLGYQYVNVDAWWQINNNRQAAKHPEMHGVARDEKGRILPNSKFPDMEALTAYIHSKGLKCGIYSSPGPFSCGGCETSWRHEYRDAARFAEWGFDYLKYDWCSYANVVKNDRESKEMFALPYRVMGQALAKQRRDIVFAMCEYGMGEPWCWAQSTGAQLWRTTGDVHDEWRLVAKAIDVQRRAWPYSKPGAWNDPDMLVLKGDHTKCRLTPNEQYTHISMWALFAAPMLIGCNLAEADDFTLGLLSNPEIVEIDQDELGAAAAPIQCHPFFEVWARPLKNGDIALGVFNPSGVQDVTAKVLFWRDLGLTGTWRFRDVWRQRDLGDFKELIEVELPAHMTQVYRIRPGKDGRMLAHLSDIRNLSWQRVFERKRPIIMNEMNANSPPPGGDVPKGFKFSP